MIKRKNIIKIAIDSPAAAGAGTVAKAISKHYNLFYLDTGKIYRMIAYLKIKFPKKFNQKFIKSKIKSLKVKDLTNNGNTYQFTTSDTLTGGTSGATVVFFKTEYTNLVRNEPE